MNTHHRDIVATTLVRQPRHADAADERWDENARFIAAAREDVPALVAEVRRLRQLLRLKCQEPDGS
ncbi:hypothetical protein [Streptomyces cavernicola]|uniref:Uncharacterized protein n=1 Tax=Streptomyces cavernicola TaxID=3043613 RepID=A0ABT6SKU1_9ACTN|nr:hypothetical protein [Streptomyces sp. B-S-A6]MDI3408815.1 hypothetical protein [Streptomyces sp. B-S-A6]